MPAQSPSPNFSIIVPAYNAGETINSCLQALNQQTIPSSQYEIIVVDDGSQDNTAQLAQAAGAKILCHSEKRGASAARNTGIAAAVGNIICFTDADCEPFSDWIETITDPLLANPQIAGCKGIYATRQKEIPARFVQVEYEDKYDRLRMQPRIDFVDTYSAAFRRQVLIANDGFDEQISYAEDRELAYRLAARGYQMVFQPDAVVYHLHSHTLARYFRKKFFIGYWVSQTLRRYPGQSINDSHTPQVMKVQILLVALLLASLVAPVFLSGWLGSWLWLAPAALAVLFLLTTVPFVVDCWKKDRAVAAASPFMLAARALALGLGYGVGLLRPLPGIVGEENMLGGAHYVLKRGMDISGGGLLFIASLVAVPIIALTIKLTSPGPILLRQEKIGQRSTPITLARFRCTNLQTGQPTAAGRFLTRWRLDKLPQWWSLVKGDISLVGPRADDAAALEHYSDWQRRRLAIKPGLTGPVQIRAQADLSLDEHITLELEYIDHYSLRRDFKIIFQTIRSIFRGTSEKSPG